MTPRCVDVPSLAVQCQEIGNRTYPCQSWMISWFSRSNLRGRERPRGLTRATIIRGTIPRNGNYRRRGRHLYMSIAQQMKSSPTDGVFGADQKLFHNAFKSLIDVFVASQKQGGHHFFHLLSNLEQFDNIWFLWTHYSRIQHFSAST